MSKIGRLPISIPAGVSVTVSKKNEDFLRVVVKGKLGELQQDVHSCINVDVKDDNVCLTVNENNQTSLDKSAMHGLFRMLINNMVTGVSTGFSRSLVLIGVGYKAAKLNDRVLDLDLGCSHKVYFVLPEEVSAEVSAEKGKNIIVTLKGCDKQMVGLVAAKIRSLRKVEPYKGKGFRYSDEVVKLKVGKTATK